MKKLLAIAVLVLAPLFAGAQQQKDVTKFLGIPVDGTKADMILKLKEKGFRTDPHFEDDLLGEFNGSNVRVSVQTNKNKVSRIIVLDFNGSSETSVKINFNHLCLQFENTPSIFPFRRLCRPFLKRRIFHMKSQYTVSNT